MMTSVWRSWDQIQHSTNYAASPAPADKLSLINNCVCAQMLWRCTYGDPLVGVDSLLHHVHPEE